MYRNNVPVATKSKQREPGTDRGATTFLSENHAESGHPTAAFPKVTRVFQFGPQASTSQEELTFDELASAGVCDETFQVRLKLDRRPTKPFKLPFGKDRIIPADMKDMSSPDHFSSTPMSYRSEIAPELPGLGKFAASHKF